MKLSFSVPGQPVAKGRARSFVRNGHVAHYTPEKTVKYEAEVSRCATVAKSSLGGAVALMAGPLMLDVAAYFRIPASWPKAKQAKARAGEIRPTSKPDLDNVVKAIKDGLNGVVWVDDSQVVFLCAQKHYSDVPHVNVTIIEGAN